MNDKNNFVTFEQAVALANLGFDNRCTHYYHEENPYFLKEVSPKTFGMYSIDYDFNYTESSDNEFVDFEGYFSAPTLAQAQTWLRKEKKHHVSSLCINENTWYYTIDDLTDNVVVALNEFEFSSYEEALSAGITECLKLLEK